MIVTVRLTVVLIGTAPKSMLVGLAAALLIPLPCSVKLIGSQAPLVSGHSNTDVVPVDGPTLVGV